VIILWCAVTKLKPRVMEYCLAKYELLTAHGTIKQQMDCRLHLLSLLPDSDVIAFMEIVRELVKVTGAICPLCFHRKINSFQIGY